MSAYMKFTHQVSMTYEAIQLRAGAPAPHPFSFNLFPKRYIAVFCSKNLNMALF
jgi:hypothetical protein